MSTSVEVNLDEKPEVYMVIADAHNRYGGASDSIDGRIPLPIADGIRYLDTTIGNIETGMELVGRGLISKVVLNGDIIDHIMSEGPNEIHEYVRAKIKSKKPRVKLEPESYLGKAKKLIGDKLNYLGFGHELDLEKYENDREFMAYVKRYVKTAKLIQKGIEEGSVAYILGNHEHEPKLIEMGIKYQKELITPNFIFAHGHPYDYFLRDLQLSPGGILYRLFTMDKITSFPGAKALSRVIKNSGRVIGFGMFHGNEIVQKGTDALASDPQFIKDLEKQYADSPDQYEHLQLLKHKHALKGLAHARMYHFMTPLLEEFKSREDYNNQMLVTGHEHDNYLGDHIVSLGNLYTFGAHFIGVDKDGNTKLIEGLDGSKFPLEAGQESYDKLFSRANVVSYTPQKDVHWHFKSPTTFHTYGEEHLDEVSSLLEKTYHYKAPEIIEPLEIIQAPSISYK